MPSHNEQTAGKTMTPATIFHRSFDGSTIQAFWDEQSTITADYPTSAGTVSVKHGHFVGGKATGVEVVYVDSGAVRALLLPGRGMGIWKLWVDDTEFGWSSPVDGPVHPSLVPVMEPGGLGWLEGFDELLVRCGLESNGAPDRDASGTLRYPLHGRIANLPARDVHVEFNAETGLVEIVGDVLETKLFFNRLRLRSRIGFHAGSTAVHIVDEVTNERSLPTTVQMLYHINLGAPVLSDGSEVEAALSVLAPKDSLSAGEMNQWNKIDAPQVGYAERVYFSQPTAGEDGWSAALLRTSNQQLGMGVRYDTSTLPYFILWKNPAAMNEGYVVGLEPATNLPNGRTFETNQGRVVNLESGATVRFQLELHPMVTSASVAQFSSLINELAKTAKTEILNAPKSGWSVT
jgi:hypothetical protein